MHERAAAMYDLRSRNDNDVVVSALFGVVRPERMSAHFRYTPAMLRITGSDLGLE